ncbi:hypothetical protein FGRMN_3748 [Fusarium graminum]|nr:hypothetical protein FGRMN_3748 [Fusarium graminum]
MLPLLQMPPHAVTPPQSDLDTLTAFPDDDTSSFDGYNARNFSSPYQQSFAIRTSRPHRHTSSFGSASYPLRQEHHLRRKTPNGTIDAGYDGSPSLFSHGPPPSKHLILPRSMPSAPFPLTDPSLRQLHFTPGNDRYRSSSVGDAGLSDDLRAHLRSSTWSYGGDAALHHGAFPSNHHGFQQAEGQYKLHGQPEAMRGYQSAYQPLIRAHEYNVRAFCPPPIVMNESLPFGQSAIHTPWNYHARPGVIPARHVQRPEAHPFQHHIPSELVYRPCFAPGIDSEPQYCRSLDPGMPIPPHPQPTHINSQQGFREKVLLQAHKIYVELLAYAQTSRRPPLAKGAPGHNTSPRLIVYPKPPKPSGRIIDGSYGHTGHTAPYVAAKSTLDMLSSLCEQSSWGWTDGIMLGGCLHYGLEQYQEALEWFSRITALDSSHVEAITNKAATLYCLGRQDEAESHWIKAVDVQPSYLEAVEHLVGLLYKKRSKQAIEIIDHVQRALRVHTVCNLQWQAGGDQRVICDNHKHDALTSNRQITDREQAQPQRHMLHGHALEPSDFASSGYAIPGKENGRILALIHAKGTMLYSLKEVNKASEAFEEAVLISAGRQMTGIQDLVLRIQTALSPTTSVSNGRSHARRPLLLPPERARHTAQLVFGGTGALPGLRHVTEGAAKRAAVQTTSNSLLSLAKIFQDSLSSGQGTPNILRRPPGVEDILALYYLSLSLQESPSTANNVGILLAGVQQVVASHPSANAEMHSQPNIPGIVPGSGLALALAYYHYGLRLDPKHVHLHTNLGSLLKDIGQLDMAIQMYEQAVSCDGNFDIALTNLANAVKDRGRINDAITYYKRAVNSNPEFAEAVCGLSTALNSVCDWRGRGGVMLKSGRYDRWHVDDKGLLINAQSFGRESGLVNRVVSIINRQLTEASHWGRGILNDKHITTLAQQIQDLGLTTSFDLEKALRNWSNKPWEESVYSTSIAQWAYGTICTHRPALPHVYMPTVSKRHTGHFTAKWHPNILLNIATSMATFHGLSATVSPESSPKHRMQSVFGFHNPRRVRAFCYATTASDGSVHRQQIEREAPVFRDVSCWSADKLVEQIVSDEIHILVNLNGYTRGARNEIFAARPAPVQMSFMGFAGTLGAEWCDYILADSTAIPPETLRPWRGNFKITDVFKDETEGDQEDWMYSENIIFCRDTFFCCDHAQSCDADERLVTWEDEQKRRWKMRKELFPNLADDTIIMGNFNQLYKIEPTTFRTWLRILAQVPKAVIWLLRFPELGEANLRRTAKSWAGEEVASRLVFTDVAPKSQHISRARVCDLFLDTPECNAHTTAADVLWSSRQAAAELIAANDEDYEKRAVQLAGGLSYTISPSGYGQGEGRVAEIRKLLWETYEQAWQRWVTGEGGDIYL